MLTSMLLDTMVMHCKQRRREIVELLLSKNVDINAQGGYYGNALKGHQEIVELLRRRGLSRKYNCITSDWLLQSLDTITSSLRDPISPSKSDKSLLGLWTGFGARPEVRIEFERL
ncbi:hypothetical protein V8E54_009423 [Elaphomyces granulatus]